MNCKFKRHDLPGVWGVSSKHMFLLAILLTLGPVNGGFVVVVTVCFKSQTYEAICIGDGRVYL